ncbi:uncharacterized protein LOC117579934 [Drosophila guanche]|uniref:Uncharacterized protein n=1 Tax=Drosophila guanche TaxID=7266 RepID=A0A3B0JQW9_DROGU|nr:uncharacterized protein LOC117579934 [Drosophila guanche]SPP76059.1 Hypothetical predicted protein [Drosophila guanche]
MSENNTEYTSEETTGIPMALSLVLNHNDTDSRSVAVALSPSTTSVAASGGASSETSSVLELRQAFSSLNERDRLRAESSRTSSETSDDASLPPSRPRRPTFMSRSTSLSSLQTLSSSSISRQGHLPIDSDGYSGLRRHMSELRLSLDRSLSQSQRHRLQRHRRLQADQMSSTATSENDENEWFGRIPQSAPGRVPTRGNSISDCSQCSSDTKEKDSLKMVTPNHQELDGWLYSLEV